MQENRPPFYISSIGFVVFYQTILQHLAFGADNLANNTVDASLAVNLPLDV